MKKRTILGFFAVSILGLWSCAGSGSDPVWGGLPGPGRSDTLQFFSREASFGMDSGRLVAPFLRRATSAGEVTLFGTRNDESSPSSIMQTAVQAASRAEGATSRAVFDQEGRPVRVTNSDDGLLLSLEWSEASVAMKFYSSTGMYQAGATVPLTGELNPVKMTAPAQGGIYQGTLAGVADGIFSLEVTGADHGSTVSTAACSRCYEPGTRSQTTDWLADFEALGGLTAASPVNTFLQKSFGRVFENGAAEGMAKVIRAAFASGDTNATIYLQSAPAFSAALTAHLNVLDGIPTGLTESEYADRGIFVAAEENSASAGYVLSTSITDPFNDSDPTFVTGLAYSRDWGTVPLQGSINGSGAFTALGSTSNGGQVTLTGTAQVTSGASGNWAINSSAGGGGGGGGGFNGNVTPPGTCNVSSGSGGQGGTIRTFNMGQSCGNIAFSYEMYGIPDQAIVTQGSAELFNTGGLVSGSRTVNLKLVGGRSTTVTVIIFAPRSGTAWDFNIGCPNSPGAPLQTRENCEMPAN